MSKFISMILFFALLSACQPTGEFDWLQGDWTRLNDKEGNSTFESWEKVSDHTYKGVGVTLQAQDTVFREDLELAQKGTKWILNVSGPNEFPVSFEITQKTNSSFIAENPKHDFPKKISYQLKRDTLYAFVSNDEYRIDFKFVKTQE